MPDSIARLAPAKINLALRVTGRRSDGYHLLDSIVVFADVGDRIEIAVANELTLDVSGKFAAHAPGDASDLAWRAAAAFFERMERKPGGDPLSVVREGPGEGTSTQRAAEKSRSLLAPGRRAAIRLEKNIPAGAGLGGGSADAAAVLLALDEVFGTHLPPDELRTVGLTLGADVPMCLTGKALRAGGIGEEISPLEGFPRLPMVLVWPRRAVSTAAAFKALLGHGNPPLPDPPVGTSPTEITQWLQNCRNDLEPPAIGMAPEIGEALGVLRATEGCLLARMSGSGSACFGLYVDREAAAAAAGSIVRTRPDWWVTDAEA